jgi:hypothetical protein
VDAAPETAFALVLRSDTALGFDVTLSRVLAGNLTVPSLGIGDSDDSAELRRTRFRMSSRKILTQKPKAEDDFFSVAEKGATSPKRRLAQEEATEDDGVGDTLIAPPACASEPMCVADVDLEVTMQATEILAEGLITTYERREEAMRLKRVWAAAAAANLTADPNAFFARTVAALGGATVVTASLTGPVVLSEKAPEPEPAFRDAFFGLPDWVDPWVLVGMAAGSIVAWTAAPRLARCLMERYGAYKVEAALARSVRRASVASGKETSAPEMRPMTRAALGQLARFKKERAKTHLERMWDRRASAAPGVAEADQFR